MRYERRLFVPRRHRDARKPAEPLVPWLVVEEEHRTRLHAGRLLARRRELDAAGRDAAQRLDVDLDALEKAAAHVDAARVPERRALAHEPRIALVDEDVDVG